MNHHQMDYTMAEINGKNSNNVKNLTHTDKYVSQRQGEMIHN